MKNNEEKPNKSMKTNSSRRQFLIFHEISYIFYRFYLESGISILVI